MALRDQWRLILLGILLVASGVTIFGPGIGATQGSTNLQYGLELAGGARIRAPVVGVTAEGVNVTGGNELQIERNVSDQLGLDLIDVQARVGTGADSGTVEVYAEIPPQRLETVLTNLGYDPDGVRQGVTEATRSSIVDVLSDKVNAVGLSGGSVSIARTTEGTHFIVVEVPNRNISEVSQLVTERGVVQMVASRPAPDANGTIRETVVRQGDIVGISQIRTQRGTPVVPVTITQAAARNFSAAMLRMGFVEQAIQGDPNDGIGGTTCNYPDGVNSSYCLLTVLNGEVVYSSGLGEGLAVDMRGGTFNQTGEFVVLAPNVSTAQELRTNLQTGALPARLDLNNGTTSFVTATRAGQYKTSSVVTALAAVVAVSVVVFIRYGRPKVAVPMIFTALSEVVVLLGFAAAIGLPLDLSHIAGFIAVIGTGVDDLIIIADEVLTEEVRSNRVFKSRFRKALWVIGAAAATTIIAMAPLTRLNLGDLQGFAIITILGVLIGVLITRPAYGDILRAILTER